MWIGTMRVSGNPDVIGVMDGWGGVDHRLMNTAWSASQRCRPKEANRLESSLYHSYTDCLSPYNAMRSLKTVFGFSSG